MAMLTFFSLEISSINAEPHALAIIAAQRLCRRRPRLAVDIQMT
jgi:hypothetical protein